MSLVVVHPTEQDARRTIWLVAEYLEYHPWATPELALWRVNARDRETRAARRMREGLYESPLDALWTKRRHMTMKWSDQ